MFGWLGFCAPSKDTGGATKMSFTAEISSPARFDQLGGSDADIRRIFTRFGASRCPLCMFVHFIAHVTVGYPLLAMLSAICPHQYIGARTESSEHAGFIDASSKSSLATDLFQRIDKNYVLTEEDVETVWRLLDRMGEEKIDVDALKRGFRELLTHRTGKRALLLVDLQNDFVDGSLAVPDGYAAVTNSNALRHKFEVVACTRDWHPADHCSFADNHGAEVFSTKSLPLPDGTTIDQVMWPRHCVQGTYGADFHPDLEVMPSDYVLDKGLNSKVDSYSGFFDNMKGNETPLRKELRARGVSEVYCVGLAYDFCVGSTAVDAVDCGFVSYLVEDCCRAVNHDTKDQMTTKLKAKGVSLCTSKQVPLPMRPSGAHCIEMAKRLVSLREGLRKGEKKKTGA
jgi:nicotinamidase/pyrazinamidase